MKVCRRYFRCWLYKTSPHTLVIFFLVTILNKGIFRKKKIFMVTRIWSKKVLATLYLECPDLENVCMNHSQFTSLS